jgi:UMF1 family MFS transporter
VLYDLGNTIFSITIVSLYFPLWVVNDMGGRDGDYGLAASLSMALVFISAPLLGALSDQAPRRMPFLVIMTLVCCAFTALLGLGSLLASLVFFILANYFYQSGLIFYDALLPAVSTDANRGRIGGLGVGLGYVGSFVGVGLGLAVLRADPAAKPLIFRLVAVLFLLFALPCFFWVREQRRAVAPFGLAAARRAVADLRDTARHVRRYPALARFLVGRVFYADAANTLIAFMGIYATNETGLTEDRVQLILLLSIAAAVGGGLLCGILVDRLGPKRTLDAILGLWAVLLGLTAAIAFLRLPGETFFLVGALAGIALGGTWAADRPFMLRLTPPRRLGQFYGLYAMVGRFAAIMGPLLWTAIVDGLGWSRPVAVLSLLLMVVIAFVVLRPVGDEQRAWTEDERVAASLAP